MFILMFALVGKLVGVSSRSSRNMDLFVVHCVNLTEFRENYNVRKFGLE